VGNTDKSNVKIHYPWPDFPPEFPDQKVMQQPLAKLAERSVGAL
jgi:hypothetical protein